MIIGLFGLSGSGKSCLSKAFNKKYPHFHCTSASEILKKAHRPIFINALSSTELDNNQKVLCHIIQQLNFKYKKLFIELHAVIEDKNGKAYVVKDEVLKSLQLDQIYVLDTNPFQILKQRKLDKNKSRPTVTVEELINLQQLEKEILNRVYGNRVKIVTSLSELELEIKKSRSKE